MRVLCVEDEVGLREDIAAFLRLQSFVVDEAENGIEALERLENAPYDAVLCDVRMPRMDGHALLGKVRENRKWAELPFVFLTAFGDSENTVQAFQQGCDNFLVKPINLEVLHQLLQSQIVRAQHRHSIAKEQREVLTSHAVHAISESLHRPMAEALEIIESLRNSKSSYTLQAVDRALIKLQHKMNNHVQDLFFLVGAMQLDIEMGTMVLSKEPTTQVELYELAASALSQRSSLRASRVANAPSVMIDRSLIQKALARLLQLVPKNVTFNEALRIEIRERHVDIYVSDHASLAVDEGFSLVEPDTNLAAYSEVTAQRVIPLMFALQVTRAHGGQLAIRQEHDLLGIRLSLPR